MTETKTPTEEEKVYDLLKKHVRKKFINSYLETKLPHYGNLTAKQFAEKHGWEEVYSVLIRVFE